MRKARIIAVITLMLACVLGIQAFACVPEWEFSGYYREHCEPNACGLLWKDPQLYDVEIWQSDCADEDGNYTREGAMIHAGFGNCC